MYKLTDADYAKIKKEIRSRIEANQDGVQYIEVDISEYIFAYIYYCEISYNYIYGGSDDYGNHEELTDSKVEVDPVNWRMTDIDDMEVKTDFNPDVLSF